MKQLIEVNVDCKTASCIVQASNRGGSRSIGIAYYVPNSAVLSRLAATPIGSNINVSARPSGKSAPCAMTLDDFTVA